MYIHIHTYICILRFQRLILAGPYIFREQTSILQNEPYTLENKTCSFQVQPHILAKMPHTLANDPQIVYILAKRPLLYRAGVVGGMSRTD